ncbi:uncharacterized protein LOC117831433 [Notolabrus celidotus]|uniref:uncharacterized protein LOC117831433 n=1 Tax=Notolabrus celidotus TaxID=1203425 RepID=UPI00148FA40D|nr:uncharacterized protein LOC117831433 [Notolabrus celidotus]
MTADMGQKQMRYSLPDEAACGVDMNREEAVLILLQHCRDMKRQETRLRLFTLLLLLLLSCGALFVLAHIYRNSGPSGQRSEKQVLEKQVLEKQVLEKQVLGCPTAVPEREVQSLHVDLISQYEEHKVISTDMKWIVKFGNNYDPERRAIVIPEDGRYLFYLRVTFRCLNNSGIEFRNLHLELKKWNERHSLKKPLMSATDSVQCRKEMFRTLSVVQQFELIKDDHVSVFIGEGYDMIKESSFGALLT